MSEKQIGAMKMLFLVLSLCVLSQISAKSQISLRRKTNFVCASGNRTCDRSAKVRMISGACNNFGKLFWGTSGVLFDRLLPHNYDDGKFLNIFYYRLL